MFAGGENPTYLEMTASIKKEFRLPWLDWANVQRVAYTVHI